MSYRIEIDAPEVPHPGGTTHADFMREAATKIERGYSFGSNLTATVSDLLRRVADEMDRAKPPRIPEPGLWGVVKAELTKGGTVWHATRYPDGWHADDGGVFDWDDLINPVLIREGINNN